jgi:hypothetical protein
MLNKYYKLITKKCDIFTGISYFFNIGIPIDTYILKEHLVLFYINMFNVLLCHTHSV